MSKINHNTMTSEPNVCINRCNGVCMLTMVSCPSVIRYDDDNNNNMPCDGAGFRYPLNNEKE